MSAIVKTPTLEGLYAELERANLNLSNPKITENKWLFAQLNKRIAGIKERIDNFGKAPAPAEVIKKEIKKVAAPKVKKEPKEKVVKTKKEKTVKAKKEGREQDYVTGISKKEISELKANPKIAKVLEIVFPKHLIQYKLYLLKLNTEQIMALTDSPKPATIRNIWYYTSGKKKI